MELKKPMDEVIAAMVRFPQVFARCMNRDVLRPALEEVGEGLAPHHIGIMKVLDDVGESYVSEIGDIMAIARAQMTQSVNRLVASGMVEREMDTKDRRKISIRLTEKGRDTIKRADKIIESQVRTKLARLGDDELGRLADSFNYVSNIFAKL